MLIALSDSPVGTQCTTFQKIVCVFHLGCRFFALSFGKHCTKLILYFTPALLCRAEGNEKSRVQRFPTPFFSFKHYSYKPNIVELKSFYGINVWYFSKGL